WAISTKLKSAEFKSHAFARWQDALGVNLQAGNTHIGVDRAQPARPFHGGGIRRAVAHVQGHGLGSRAQQRRNLGMISHPPVTAPQPSVVAGSTGNNAKWPTSYCISAQIMCMVGHEWLCPFSYL